MKLGGWKSEKMVLRCAHVNVSHLANSIAVLPWTERVVMREPDAGHSEMSPEEAIAEFQEYERRLASILENFSTGQNSTNIDEDDDPLYRQYVQELIDLFDDMMGQNQYSKQINSYFSDGIQNFTESPSYKSVENILGVVRAALTRMRRNRDVLRFADSFPSPPTSTSTHTLIAETGRLGSSRDRPAFRFNLRRRLILSPYTIL